MDRGQSTVEVAIAFPVVIAILWWTIVPPLAGIRALAARSAALAGARSAAVEDHPDAGRTGRSVAEHWKRMGGAGYGKQVEVSLSPRHVVLKTRETAPEAGKMNDFLLELEREKD
ncbi:MAG: hypothetical protein ACM3XZ_00570 [Betaproteobacteria bacterium]